MENLRAVRAPQPASPAEFGLVSFLGPARRQLPPALHHRDFRRLWSGFFTSGFATQMVAVAVGWQVYAIHRAHSTSA